MNTHPWLCTPQHFTDREGSPERLTARTSKTQGHGCPELTGLGALGPCPKQFMSVQQTHLGQKAPERPLRVCKEHGGQERREGGCMEAR